MKTTIRKLPVELHVPVGETPAEVAFEHGDDERVVHFDTFYIGRGKDPGTQKWLATAWVAREESD